MSKWIECDRCEKRKAEGATDWLSVVLEKDPAEDEPEDDHLDFCPTCAGLFFEFSLGIFDVIAPATRKAP